MFTVQSGDLRGGPRDVEQPDWSSLRLLVATDGLGYSLNDTVVYAGTAMTLEYRNHIETCFCIAGDGEILDMASGEVHRIRPGTVYVLDKHDRHELRVDEGADMRLISIFTPALRGDEVHGPDGSYAAAD